MFTQVSLITKVQIFYFLRCFENMQLTSSEFASDFTIPQEDRFQIFYNNSIFLEHFHS